MKSWQWYEDGKLPLHPSKEGESLPGCPIAGVLAALLKNDKNGLQNFLISIILKVELHGFLHFVLCFDTNKSARLDFKNPV